MKLLLLSVLTLSLACFCLPALAAGPTREEVRSAYRAIGAIDWESPYAALPSVASPYQTGELTAAATEDALGYLNFMRGLAGLEPVELSRIYNYQCQQGAVLLAALDYADHYAPRPDDMDVHFYESAHIATTSGNLAKFNWMRPEILRDGLAYFARDDGEANLPLLGHRRWLLNPLMSDTGFGLANSQAGMSYVVMYAHDFGNPNAEWTYVLWPSEGAFPAELMHDHLAWSVTLNPAVYDIEHSSPRVTLTEPSLGLSFSFTPDAECSGGFCTLNTDNYGAGPCLIFRPDFTGASFTDYLQNQRWTVTIDGLLLFSGEPAPLSYTTEMISLNVQDAVNVELSQLEAVLSPGETLALSAQVIPSYADDLSVTWFSDDESVAAVTQDGLVTALRTGTCSITAETANGRSDFCEVTVTQ